MYQPCTSTAVNPGEQRSPAVAQNRSLSRLAERRRSAPTLREKRSPSGNERVGKRLEDLGERDRPIGAGGDEGAVDRRQREPRHPVDDAAASVVVARDGDLSPESREGEFADVAHGFGNGCERQSRGRRLGSSVVRSPARRELRSRPSALQDCPAPADADLSGTALLRRRP